MNWKGRIIFAITSGLGFAMVLYLFDLLGTEKIQTTFGLIFQGVFFGIFFGLGFPYISEKVGGRFASKLGQKISPELSENENIEVEIPANLFRGIEGVGGKLFLTNKKLIFKSHKLNIQTGQTNIDYAEITDVIKRKTAKIANNGIRIKIKSGKEFDFVVNEREKCIEKLNKKIKESIAF